jgi:hypothetical protein
MGDGLRRDERALERVRRADVGLGRPLAHGNADAGAGEIDAAAGNDLAVLDQAIDRLGGQDGEVAALVPMVRSKSGARSSITVFRPLVQSTFIAAFLSRFPTDFSARSLQPMAPPR